MSEADSHVDHRPVADEDEDCLCLIVTDAPLRLTGWLGRLLNPFIRIYPAIEPHQGSSATECDARHRRVPERASKLPA